MVRSAQKGAQRFPGGGLFDTSDNLTKVVDLYISKTVGRGPDREIRGLNPIPIDPSRETDQNRD